MPDGNLTDPNPTIAPIDFEKVGLRRKLAATRRVNDDLHRQIQEEANTHTVPREFVAALRHGSPSEPYRVPIDDDMLIVFLARAGDGHARRLEEADAWRALKRVAADLRGKVPAGVMYVRRMPLPSQISKVVWTFGGDGRDHVATIANTRADPPVRAARVRRRRRHGGPVVGGFAVAGVAILGRRIVDALQVMLPAASSAAVSMAAVTAIICPSQDIGGSAPERHTAQQQDNMPLPSSQPATPRKRRRASAVPQAGAPSASPSPSAPVVPTPSSSLSPTPSLNSSSSPPATPAGDGTPSTTPPSTPVEAVPDPSDGVPVRPADPSETPSTEPSPAPPAESPGVTPWPPVPSADSATDTPTDPTDPASVPPSADSLDQQPIVAAGPWCPPGLYGAVPAAAGCPAA